MTRRTPAPYELADPHAYLGAHPARGGVVVRAYRPDAESIRVLPMGVELDQQDGDGVFEGVVKGARLPLDYELEVGYPTGDSYVLRDPYSFLPTLGELDVHLAGEGRHEELYARLGAHRARWTASPESRSGSGRRTPARSASSVTSTAGTDVCIRCARSAHPESGSSSFPTSEPGTRYKFELRTSDGKLRLKADPFAFAAEVPPSERLRRLRIELRVARRRLAAPRARARSAGPCRSTRCTWAPGG